MARGRFYLPGWLYTEVLDLPLQGIRRKVSEISVENALFPLLDLCCGPGTQAGFLSRAGGTIVGLDINLKMVRYAAAKHPRIPFLCSDAVRTPFRAGAFRGIVISFALHEKEAAFRASLLKEAVRVLAPGGGIVLVDFERPWDRTGRLASLYVSPIERLAGRAHFRNGRDFLRRGGLRALLLENGLREVERRDISAGSCAVVLAVPGRLPGPNPVL
jgi:demethylmenaquinone methyltransferase/2-methoxy-6-polyprenyl-1,4-benzoquinol methylase